MDWWQAILVLLAGGLISGVTAYATHRWTTSASREAEERQAKQTLQQEQRQAIKQLRRERMQPVLDFFNVVKQSAAREPVKSGADMAYEGLSPERKPPPEEWERMKGELFAADPDPIQETIQVGRACMAAGMACVFVPGLLAELAGVYVALMARGDPRRWDQLAERLRSAEQLLEQYLAGAEPHERASDEPSQET